MSFPLPYKPREMQRYLLKLYLVGSKTWGYIWLGYTTPASLPSCTQLGSVYQIDPNSSLLLLEIDLYKLNMTQVFL